MTNNIVGKWEFLKVEFHDGKQDTTGHPHVCLTNLTKLDGKFSCLTLKGTTYRPQKKYQVDKIKTNQACTIMLNNQTWFCEEELYIVNEDILKIKQGKFKEVENDELIKLLNFVSNIEHEYCVIFSDELKTTFDIYL